eukprot:tig00021428_g21168.t1
MSEPGATSDGVGDRSGAHLAICARCGAAFGGTTAEDALRHLAQHESAAREVYLDGKDRSVREAHERAQRELEASRGSAADRGSEAGGAHTATGAQAAPPSPDAPGAQLQPHATVPAAIAAGATQ